MAIVAKRTCPPEVLRLEEGEDIEAAIHERTPVEALSWRNRAEVDAH